MMIKMTKKELKIKP